MFEIILKVGKYDLFILIVLGVTFSIQLKTSNDVTPVHQVRIRYHILKILAIEVAGRKP